MTATISAVIDTLLPATRSGRLLVLIYHRVRPKVDALFPDEVTADVFRRQMQWLGRYCAPLPLLDAVTRLKAGTLPARACAVTFDDGYADNAAVALPILAECGVPATFFVATGFLDGGRMWNDSVIEAIRLAPDRTLDATALGLGTLTLADTASRRVAALAVIRAIKHLSHYERQRKVDTLCAQVDVTLPTDLMMRREQVRELARAGMEIGAHTVNHPILRTLAEEQASDEIQRSREELQAMTGAPIRSFAYPNGRPDHDYTLRDRNLVQQLGFEYAVSTTRGACHAGSDFFQLPRFTPWDRSAARWLGRLFLEYGRSR